ncbi:hypothetical protein [Cystobacter fuscus]|uniref:hypothetical protein n=1 Tax=Cystobacter fuscus TaxID=43 RepID=UPI0012FD4E4E|nr:hypothetical protein [Cystobacter fuscus]
MSCARPVRVDVPPTSSPPSCAWGCPRPAASTCREYLLEKLPALHVLLTGLELK